MAILSILSGRKVPKHYFLSVLIDSPSVSMYATYGFVSHLNLESGEESRTFPSAPPMSRGN